MEAPRARDTGRSLKCTRRATCNGQRACNALFRNIVERNVDAIVVIDRDGIIRYANPAACGMLGKPVTALVGQPFGYPLRTREPQELDIVTSDGRSCCAEMRLADIQLNGERLLAACLRDITELVRLRDELRALSLVDDLTGLYNRRGLRTLMEQQVRLAERHGRDLVYLLADIDDLKSINDTLGHHTGDLAIRSAAEVLRHTFRSSDIIARIGGDEFVVVALESHGVDPERLVERLHLCTDAWNRKNDLGFTLTLSVGATRVPPDMPGELSELIVAADAGMYAVKREKRTDPAAIGIAAVAAAPRPHPLDRSTSSNTA